MVAPAKESDLVCAVLLYAARCRQEGDTRALRAMNFGIDELAAVEELGLVDLTRAHQLRAHCLDIRLDRAAFWPMIGRLKQWRSSEQLQQSLVCADAPADMMRALFGMDAKEYTRSCRELGVRPTMGRPTEPDEMTEKQLWDAWQALNNGAPVSAEQFLQLSEQTGVNVRTVWRMINRWTDL